MEYKINAFGMSYRSELPLSDDLRSLTIPILTIKPKTSYAKRTPRSEIDNEKLHPYALLVRSAKRTVVIGQRLIQNHTIRAKVHFCDPPYSTVDLTSSKISDKCIVILLQGL